MTDGDWTPELVDQFRTRFHNDEACRHCGGIHVRACPRVKLMRFHPNGSLAEVEFWQENQWSDDHVVWSDQIPDLDEQADKE